MKAAFQCLTESRLPDRKVEAGNFTFTGWFFNNAHVTMLVRLIKINIKIKKGLGLHTTSEIYSVNNWKYSTRLPSPSPHLGVRLNVPNSEALTILAH